MSTTILYPDLHARGLWPGGFADRLVALDLGRVVALVNGEPHPPPLPAGLPDLFSAPGDVEVLTTPRGLVPALRSGYRAVLATADHPGVVVRIDTSEHPIERISDLAGLAAIHGGAVGDLAIPSWDLRPESFDQRMARDIFPTLTARTTDGALCLGNAHGFQAWRLDVLARILPSAERLWDRAEATGPLHWGFDLALALAACALGMPPVITHYPASILRDRPREKILAQFDSVVRICLAYREAATARDSVIHRDSTAPRAERRAPEPVMAHP